MVPQTTTEMKINKIIYHMIVALLFWVAISTTIQAFKCPDMTRTELFLRIPKSFICNWLDSERWKTGKNYKRLLWLVDRRVFLWPIRSLQKREIRSQTLMNGIKNTKGKTDSNHKIPHGPGYSIQRQMKLTLIILTLLIGSYCLIMAIRQLVRIVQEHARYTRRADWILAIIGQVIMILGTGGITATAIIIINQFKWKQSKKSNQSGETDLHSESCGSGLQRV